MDIIYNGWNCDIIFDKYVVNARTAILLIDKKDGSPVADATTNIIEEYLESDEVIIKDHSENTGMLKSLVENKIVSEPIRFVKSGFVTFPVCKLLVSPSN